MTTRNVSMCAPRVIRHTSIRYLSPSHTQASTSVHRYSSLLQWSVTLGQRGHVGRILCTKCTLHSIHRLTVWYCNTQNNFSPPVASIFSIHALASPKGWNANYDEEQLTVGKKCLRCFFYLYRFGKHVSYGFPVINFCYPAVHFGTHSMCLSALHTATRKVIIFTSHTERQYSRIWKGLTTHQ